MDIQDKKNLDGSIKTYKRRLVAQYFSQVHGIDYTEIFAPTIRQKLLQIFLIIVTMLEMIL